jgi:hypothetical protein
MDNAQKLNNWLKAGLGHSFKSGIHCSRYVFVGFPSCSSATCKWLLKVADGWPGRASQIKSFNFTFVSTLIKTSFGTTCNWSINQRVLLIRTTDLRILSCDCWIQLHPVIAVVSLLPPTVPSLPEAHIPFPWGPLCPGLLLSSLGT